MQSFLNAPIKQWGIKQGQKRDILIIVDRALYKLNLSELDTVIFQVVMRASCMDKSLWSQQVKILGDIRRTYVEESKKIGLEMYPICTFRCPICLKDEEHSSDFISLRCSHKFHPDCIDEWCKINNTCPMCRVVIA